MRKRGYKYYIFKSHRYFGVILGVQFVLWTISGVFFSWTTIREIRGDHLRAEPAVIEPAGDMISPTAIFTSLKASDGKAQVTSFRLVNVLGEDFYEVVSEHQGGHETIALFDTKTGLKRAAVTKDEAIKIAESALKEPAKVRDALYLTEKNVGGHHEYRDQPLPAWAVSFEQPEDLTVYLTATSGQVRSFRTSNWRIFDFLWMLHTMDFVARDDINNWALRIFSGLGMVMLASGFLYFAITFKKPWGKKGS